MTSSQGLTLEERIALMDQRSLEQRISDKESDQARFDKELQPALHPLETIFKGIGKTGSMSREALDQLGLVLHGGEFEPDKFADIMKGKTVISAQDVKKDIEKKFGIDLTLDDETLGKNTATAVNLASDVFIDAVTDPIGFVALPKLFSYVNKGIGASKLSQGVAAKFGEKAGKVVDLGAKGVLPGATIGALSMDENDTAADILGKTVMGAVAGASLGMMAGASIPAIQTVTDAMYLQYLKVTRPKAVGDILEQIGKSGLEDKTLRGLVKAANGLDSDPQRQQIARKILEGRTELIDDLHKRFGDDAILQSQDIVDSALEQTITRRHQFEDVFLKNIHKLSNGSPTQLKQNLLKRARKDLGSMGISETDAKRLIDEIVPTLDDKFAPTQASLNIGTKESNTYVRNWLQHKYVNQIKDPALRQHMTSFMDDWAVINREAIDGYNKVKKGQSLKLADDEHIDIAAIDFHTGEFLDDEVLEKLSTGEGFISPKALAEFKKKSRTSVRDFKEIHELVKKDPRNAAIIRAEIGRRRMLNSLADQGEKFARRVVAKLPDTDVELSGLTGDVFKNFEKSVELFDEYTSYFKSMVLGLNHAWIKNNYYDNALKAIMELGLDGADISMRSNPAARWLPKSTMAQLARASDPKKAYRGIKFDDESLRVAQDMGLVDNDFFKSIRDVGQEDMVELLAFNSTDQVAAKLAKLEAKNKGTRGLLNDFQKQTSDRMIRWGSVMEGTFKAKSFDAYLKGLLKSKNPTAVAAKKAIDNIGLEKAMLNSPEAKEIAIRARDMVNKTFFDYNNLSLGERAIAKRIMPFYTFFSRNFEFWGKKAVEEFDKFQAALRPGLNIGREPTKEERRAIPEYMLKNAPRIRNTLSDGSIEVATMPQMSFNEALIMLGFNGDSANSSEALNKFNPLLKSVYQMAFDKDVFLGGEFWPSSKSSGKKSIFQAAPFDIPFGNGFLDTDPNTKRTTTSHDIYAGAQELFNLGLPLPVLQTALSKARKLGQGKINLDDVKESLLTPVQPKTIEPRTQAMTKSIKLRNTQRKLRMKGGK